MTAKNSKRTPELIQELPDSASLVGFACEVQYTRQGIPAILVALRWLYIPPPSTFERLLPSAAANFDTFERLAASASHAYTLT